MKILHLGKFYFPKKGGIETATKDIAEFSAKNKKNRISVLCNGDENKNLKVNNVDVHYFKFLSIFNQPISLKYFYWFINNYKKYDIIHFHVPNYFTLAFSFFLKKNSKMIIHWHADIEKISFPLSILLRFIEKYSLRRSELILVGTKRYAKSSKSLNPFFSKVRIVPYGIQINKNTKCKKSKNILSVGRLVNYKGLIPILKRIKKIENWKWIIVGNGPQIKEINLLTKKNKLQDFIEIKGSVSDNELSSLYKNSSIFLFPSISRQESFGIVQLEAMNNYCSIINFDIPGSGVSEITKNGYTGYTFQLNDYKNFLEGLYYLTENEKYLDEIQNNSNLHVSEKYSLENYCKNIYKLYEEILN